MNVWIVNASPLILLGKINQLHLLAKRAGLVPAVRPAIAALLRSGALLHDLVIRDALQLADES